MNSINKFKITINNPNYEEILYVESSEENPLFEGGQLNSYEYVILMASYEKDMSDIFNISISPRNCGLIKIEKIKD